MPILIAFFSMNGETMGPDMNLITIAKGYNAAAAEFIQEAIGGDLFEIEPAKPYSRSHEKLIEEAKYEQENNIHHEIKRYPENMDRYDTIFLCYPNWWSVLPMPVVTFLENIDWTGKTIIPFSTSDGSGAGGTRQEIISLCKGAMVKKVFEIRGYEVDDSKRKIQDWAITMIRNNT